VEITFLDAWTMWLQGSDIQSRLLWGYEIYWWGRLGLIVVFVSALTTLAAVIGHERLEDARAEVRTRAGIKRNVMFALRPVIALLRTFGLFRKPRTESEDDYADDFEDQDDNDDIMYFVFLALVAVGIVGYVLYSSGEFFPAWPRYMAASEIIPFVIDGGIAFAQFLGLVLALLFGMALIATSALLVLSLPGLIVSYVLIAPLAFLLSLDTVDRFVKVMSAVLLAAGFHFILLAA